MSAPSGAQATWQGPLPTPQRQRRGVLAPVLGAMALGICGLLAVGLGGSGLGVGGVVVGALCALLPVGPVVATFLWLDRWEPEPPRLLLLAFAWGAGVATLTALLVNTGGELIAAQLIGAGGADVVATVIVAPIAEEAVKGVFLVGLLVFNRREFDGMVDGVVYAGLVAAGFAFTENILYFGAAFVEDAMSGASSTLWSTFFLRGLLGPFAHPLFTAMLGIACGIAAQNRNGTLRVAVVAVGYVAAVGLHMLWNGAASLGNDQWYSIYGSVMVPLFFAQIGLVLWQRRREQRIVAEQLPEFAKAGWIAPSEVALLSSLAGRRGWQRAVRARSGKAVAKAVVEYQAAVTELAFLRAKMSRGAVQVSGPLWHEQAVAALYRARLQAVGHPQALTVALRHGGPSRSSRGPSITPPITSASAPSATPAVAPSGPSPSAVPPVQRSGSGPAVPARGPGQAFPPPRPPQSGPPRQPPVR
ncbi:PrsW family intramembrane metalloprotease [Pseudonocardia humida]|uniref:PrsW family intramembrane metalloprotease n=1 Tax=Pseudonocardia humida TaxID=2800819 RepID=A0ABT0ZWU6_9PSEU|nr:PrsW family glutamic-type intramembrane protease [Pseudonocardia humida]MCO1655210.1 PrsW family intramembrane metalloprotease [Pseudonocardia humida]